MAQTPRKPQPPAASGSQQPPLTRRGRARWQRERQRQRRVLIIAGVAVGLSLLAILAGLLYEQVWIPSRPVAQANDASLSRGDYWNERRQELARRIAQSIRLVAMFGDQFGSQFGDQTPALNQQAASIRTAPVDEETVQGWLDRQIIVQSAAREFGAQATDGEIAQRLAADLGPIFAPAPPLPAPTAALTATLPLTATEAAPTAAPAATLAATAEPTAALEEATATAGPTGTPEPTPVPTVTPPAEEALRQQEQIVGRIWDTYLQEIQRTDPQARPNLTIEDFRDGLRNQYAREVVTEKVQERLVPEAGFAVSSDPNSIATRHILIKVTVPLTATESEREAAYAARRPEAEALLAELRAGADFATVARERSEDFTTRERGGELPPFDKEGKTREGSQVDPVFVTATLALQENQISDLVRTPFGWHVIQLISRTIPSKEEQLREARTKAFDVWVDQQRAAASIQRFPAVSPTAVVPTEAPAPLPTVPLGGEPTPITDTTSLTDTMTLTDTAALTDTGTLTDTALPETPLPTVAPTAAQP